MTPKLTTAYPDRLSILTFNVAMGRKSAAAGAGWGDAEQLAALQSTVAVAAADVVILQECGLKLQGSSEDDSYVVAASTKTHCGITSILVSKSVLEVARMPRTMIGGPCVVLDLDSTLKPHNRISVCGAHLMPFSQGADERLRALRGAVDVDCSACSPLKSVCFHDV